MENNFENQNIKNQVNNPQDNPQYYNGYSSNIPTFIPNAGYERPNSQTTPFYVPQYAMPAPEPEYIKEAKRKESICLILGIMSFIGFFLFFIFPIATLLLSIPALIFGTKAKKVLLKSGKITTGKVFSVISIILSVFMTVMLTVFIYIPLATFNPSKGALENYTPEELSEEIEDHFIDYYNDLGIKISKNDLKDSDKSPNYDELDNLESHTN